MSLVFPMLPSVVLRRAVLLAALVAAVPSVQAQTWVPVGPPGGDVRSLGFDPREPKRIYLGTADGVLYRSDDAGLNWGRLTPGFPMREAASTTSWSTRGAWCWPASGRWAAPAAAWPAAWTAA